MRIEGWSVDAFGHLSDSNLDGLTSGVNVVVGPNEAGKTTLLHFLRWVLFGFPHHANASHKQYKPETGNFGGRVRLMHDDRLIVVERHVGNDHPSLMNDNGSPVTDLTWGDIVGTAKLELFESVFAITVDELNDFGQLDNDDVREHIYAASVVGAGRSVRTVLSQLDNRRKSDLGPRSGEIRSLGKQLKAALDELHEAQRQARDLPAQRDQVAALGEAVETRRGERETLTAQAARVDKLLALWPRWSAAAAAREQLEQGPPALELPHPLDKLDAALEKVSDTEAAVADAKSALASTVTSIEAITLDEALLAVAADVSVLDRGLGANDGIRSQLAQQEPELERTRALVVERMQELGPDWDTDRLAALDTSVGVAAEVDAYGEQLDSARDAERTAETTARARRVVAEERTEELSGQRLELERVRARFVGVTDMSTAHTAATQLRQLLPQLEAERLAAGGNERLALALEQINRGSGSSFPTWVAPALFVVALVAAVGAVVGFATDDAVLGGLLGAVAAALAVVGIVTFRSGAGVAVPVGGEPSDQATPGLAKHSAPLSERVAAAGAVAGLGAQPTVQAVDQLLDNLRSETKLAEDAETTSRKCGLAKEDFARATRDHQQSVDAKATAQSKWDQWLAEHGLPAGLTPDAAATFIDRAKSARESTGAADQIEQQVATLRKSADQYLQKLTDVFVRAGLELDNDPYAELVKLAQRAKQEDDARQQRRILEAQLPGHKASVTEAEQATGQAANALAELFKTAGVKDEDEFRSMANAQIGRLKLVEIVHDVNIQFTGAFGEGAAADSARKQLATGEVEIWEGDKTRLAEAGRAAVAEYESAVRDSHDAANTLEALQNSADVPERSQKVEELRSAMEEAMERWAIATLAHRAIDETLGDFERERQPAVVKRAAESFARITDNRYVNLVPGDGSLHAVLPSGGRIDATLLSRGTTEQLYLAMRFGLALDYAEKSPLPLILDDVLVNADFERRHRLADELERVSQDIQVVLFTCHPETADLLSDGRPDTTVKQLQL